MTRKRPGEAGGSEGLAGVGGQGRHASDPRSLAQRSLRHGPAPARPLARGPDPTQAGHPPRHSACPQVTEGGLAPCAPRATTIGSARHSPWGARAPRAPHARERWGLMVPASGSRAGGNGPWAGRALCPWNGARHPPTATGPSAGRRPGGHAAGKVTSPGKTEVGRLTARVHINLTSAATREDPGRLWGGQSGRVAAMAARGPGARLGPTPPAEPVWSPASLPTLALPGSPEPSSRPPRPCLGRSPPPPSAALPRSPSVPRPRGSAHPERASPAAALGPSVGSRALVAGDPCPGAAGRRAEASTVPVARGRLRLRLAGRAGAGARRAAVHRGLLDPEGARLVLRCDADKRVC